MSIADSRLVFRSRAAQAVALVRAFEETDRRGLLLAHEARRDATAAALEGGEGERSGRGGDAAWLGRRARTLGAALGERFSFLPRLLRFTDPARGLLLPVILVAVILGLATNALGPANRVHVLALPLLGILAWNVAVLVLLFARRFLPLGAWWRAGRPLLLEILEAWSRRLVERLPRRDERGESEILGAALERYLTLWLPAAATLGTARVRRLLHAAAFALLVGVIGGMYLRGVGFAYRASWESTFLDAATVDAVLGIVLGPAAWILDTAIPSAAEIEAPASGDAAPWIHLWAVTAGGVGLPRLLLAAWAALRCWRLGRRLELEVPEVYRRRLRAAASTATHRVEVAPYSYRPSAAVSDALRARLHDVFGARCEIRIRSKVEYGASAGDLELTGGRGCLALFNLAQTPEVEVHGEFLSDLRDILPDGQVLLVLVEGSLYRERMAPGAAGEDRLEQRRRAWDRVVAGVDLKAVHLDLRRVGADEGTAALIAGAWPPQSLG